MMMMMMTIQEQIMFVLKLLTFFERVMFCPGFSSRIYGNLVPDIIDSGKETGI
jgi:hypothetical protein